MYKNEEYESPGTFLQLLLSLYFFFSFPVIWNKIEISMNNALEAPQIVEDVCI